MLSCRTKIYFADCANTANIKRFSMHLGNSQKITIGIFVSGLESDPSPPVPQSKMTSIFFLTSIFNHSIHSSIAVFYLRPHIHEKWKGRIETWQPEKAKKKAKKK